jgi:hypothetical protein
VPATAALFPQVSLARVVMWSQCLRMVEPKPIGTRRNPRLAAQHGPQLARYVGQPIAIVIISPASAPDRPPSAVRSA